jgi:site-specific DNA-methyltransferase (adenine-specific)
VKDFYYTKDGLAIINDNCMNVLPELADKSVDLCLTDFPYANGTEYDGYEDTQENLKKLIDAVMPEILRVSKVALIAVGIGNMWLYPRPRWVLSWHWTHTQSGSSWWGFNNWQPVLAYGPDPYLANRLGRRQDSMGGFPSPRERLDYPCPKPIQPWEWFLLRGSVSDHDLILDPLMGSGTTLIVAKKHGRRCIGIDISEKYCELARNRLESL